VSGTVRRAPSIWSEETREFEFRVWVAMAMTRILPPLVGNRTRATALRLAGVRVGRGTTFGGAVHLSGSRVGTQRASARLVIGERCWINAECLFDASDEIIIGDEVAIAQGVALITNTHEIGSTYQRAGQLRRQPIRVGSGSWIGARSIILPGVDIGEGCVVAAGSVVTRSVERDTLVGGVPARVIRNLADYSIAASDIDRHDSAAEIG
jgi:maltose O-acetyltransferase